MTLYSAAVGRRHKKTTPSRPGLRLSLRCVCGGTLSSYVAMRPTDAIKMRDIYLSFHRDAGCVVTDASKDVP